MDFGTDELAISIEEFCIGKENLRIIYKNNWFLTGEYAKIKTEKMQKVSVFLLYPVIITEVVRFEKESNKKGGRYYVNISRIFRN